MCRIEKEDGSIFYFDFPLALFNFFVDSIYISLKYLKWMMVDIVTMVGIKHLRASG